MYNAIICYTMSDTQETPQAIRLTGQVKWFNTKAGFGFITVCDSVEHSGKDIFVHYKSIKVENSQYRYLVQGEYVEFLLVKPESDKYEFHAVDVTGIKGGAIMCETRRASQESQPVRPERPPIRRYRTNFQGRRGPPRQRPAEQSSSDAQQAPAEDGFEKVVRKRDSRPPRKSGQSAPKVA